ncbi:MAG: bifunctional acetate--CoA ligase family protein/GNAT family N-acetyltransferase [Terriglobia bacterium]|jgi:acetyltransferase
MGTTSKPGIKGETLRHGVRPLDVFFAPQSVAVIGATETAGTVGRTLLWNLIRTPFGGTVYPINPKRKGVLGIKAYPSVLDVPEKVDLAVLAIPASAIPAAIHQCGEKGVPAAVIISAGFKEIGPAGVELERQVLVEAQESGMRIIGPNCLGVMCPRTGLNATFASAMARPGGVGFVSQSGALCTAVLDWSLGENVGFSAFVSIGSMLDVNWGDLIDYLGDDPHTRSIVIYMESIGDARSFLSAAREVALAKPIIVLKAGRTEAAAKAAASHTGALAGSDDVLDAAFRRCGVLRVNTIGNLFAMADILGKQPRPKGPRLTVLTNAGGPGVLAADALIVSGGELAELSSDTMAQLNQLLPAAWSHNNPIDILGDAPPERYAKAVEIVAKDPGSDGLLVVLTPQGMTDPTQTAEHLRPYAKLDGKPVLASWMGGPEVAAGTAILSRANIPVFPYPDAAARAFHYMWEYSYNLKGIYETPSAAAAPEDIPPDRASAEKIIQKARGQGRVNLTELESKQMLSAYHIPTVETRVATSAEQAVELAREVGYPVVLKLHSETILHKTDVNGVQLNLRDADGVRGAYGAIESSVNEKAGPGHFLGVTVQPMIRTTGYEIILGSSLDPQFGPVLLFGSGGQLVEVYKDHALALPPLNTTLARRMIEQTRIYTALTGVRGRKAIDLEALEQLMVRFSQLVVEQPWIKEIDINPLLVSPDQFIALDARMVMHDLSLKAEELPKLAIRPYPIQYVTPWALKDGTPAMVRPIRPEDEPLMVSFHQRLSERTVYFRYFGTLQLSQRITHERLTRICFNDYDRQMALVVDLKDPKTGEHEILGVGRITKLHTAPVAEFAIMVADRYQRQGVGGELMRRLLQVARDEKIQRLVGYMLTENFEMQRLCQKLGFELDRSKDDPAVRATLDL